MPESFDSQPESEMSSIMSWLWALVFWSVASALLSAALMGANHILGYVEPSTAVIAGAFVGALAFLVGVFTRHGRALAAWMFSLTHLWPG